MLDDVRLKNPPVAGSGVPDRFDELLDRIRDIRSSERRMYLRVREIFAMAADYSPSLPARPLLCTLCRRAQRVCVQPEGVQAGGFMTFTGKS